MTQIKIVKMLYVEDALYCLEMTIIYVIDKYIDKYIGKGLLKPDDAERKLASVVCVVPHLNCTCTGLPLERTF